VSIYEFKENDIIFNTIEAHPKCEFLIYSGTIYYNDIEHEPGAFATNVLGTSNGFISLYEMNVDRTVADTGVIYPFVTKDGSQTTFSTITTSDYNTQFSYGDTITGSYPLTASITRDYFASTTRRRIQALKNTLNYHTRLSPHYEYTSSYGDKSSQTINLFSIPSIFYGSSIQKGTVGLKFYVTGTLIGELRDERQNGELIQVGPTGSTGTGSVAGVVLYDEGFVLLTGSWALDENSIDYLSDPTDAKNSSWIYFGVGANDGATPDATITSASYVLDFHGTERVPSLMMLAHAPVGKLNFSNNPTFIQSSSVHLPLSFTTSSNSFEQSLQAIKNTVSSSYADPDAAFKRQVFITKIGIYDKDKNLIAIASIANPVKKQENDQYTFKLKLDL